MVQWIVLAMLGLYAIEDIRKRTISTSYLVLFGIMGIVMQYCRRTLTVFEILLGITVGIALLGISYMTRESIGRGDGLIFLVTGIFLGGAANMELLFISLLYAAVFSLGILIFRKKKRKQEIPFIPFVFLGYFTMVLGAGL